MPESIQQQNNKMDKRDEEILELKQKLIDLMKENNEMKELILFLDDERNYAKQFVKQFNTKQSLNWNSLKQKLNYLEQKQYELIKENLSLKQLCVLLDENCNLVDQQQQQQQNIRQKTNNQSSSSELTKSSSIDVCQYILQLENEIKSFNNNNKTKIKRPKYVQDIMKLYSLNHQFDTLSSSSSSTNNNDNQQILTTTTTTSTNEEKSIIYSLSETAIKSIVFNGNNCNNNNNNNTNINNNGINHH